MPTPASLSNADTRPRVVTTREALRQSVSAARQAGQTIGLVPTMGALHAGHISLAEKSRRECQFTVATIFVNPLQFGPQEDFSRYPRTLEADLEKLASAGVDLVFAPEIAEMVSVSSATMIDVGPIAEPLEGLCRPSHFRGVATIVLKLLNLTTPDIAYFGQKDYQQCLVIRRMVEDLDLPVTIRVCPIVREPDGLAMSSRNRYLSPDERRRALSLSRGLRLARELVESGETDASVIRFRMAESLAEAGDLKVDYLALADPESLSPVTTIRGPTVALVAAWVGSTRLIDNEVIQPLNPLVPK